MTVAHGIQDPIQMIEQAVGGVGRARRRQALISRSKVITVATQLVDHLRHRAVERGPGPLGQAPQTLRALTFGCSLLHAPGPIEDLTAQRPPAARFDLEDGEPTTAAYGRRDHDFFSSKPGDLLVGAQILRHVLGALDGRADQIGTSKTEPRPIPEHRLALEDRGQGREWHAPLPPEECFLHFLRARAERGHEERGPQRENLRGGLELDPSQNYPLFARPIAVMEGIPLAHRLRKQFRVASNHLRQRLAVLRHVGHTLLILRFTLKGQADRLAATGWGLLLQLCVFHHSTVWRIFVLPSPLFFRL